MLLSLTLLACSITQGQTTPPTARARAKHQLALRAAAQQVVDTIKPDATLPPELRSQLIGELSEAMLTNIPAHARHEASLALCVDLIVTAQQTSLDRSIDAIIAAANRESPATIQRDDVLPLIAKDWDAHLYLQATTFASTHASALFEVARPRSVAVQRDQLRLQVPMPSETELNTQLAAIQRRSGTPLPPPTALDTLLPWLVKHAQKDTPALFQEVHHTTENAARQVIQNIRAQYEGQTRELNQAVNTIPPEAVLREQIQDHLLHSLHTHTDALRNDTHDAAIVIYSPLTPITQDAIARAPKLEAKRLGTAILALPPPKLDLGNIAATLQQHPEDHIHFKPSLTHFADAFLPKLIPWFANALISHLEPLDPAPIRDLLTARLAQPGHEHNAARQHIEKQLAADLRDVRDAYAVVQLTNLLGSMPSTSTPLPTAAMSKLITSFPDLNPNNFDNTWRILTGIDLIKKPDLKPLLFEESHTRLIAWAQHHIPQARKAHAEQLRLLAQLETEWTPQLKADVAQQRPIEEITTDWTTELTTRWTQQNTQLQLPYPALFPHTRDLLEKIIRKLYDAAIPDETDPTESAVEKDPLPEEIETEEPTPEEPEPEEPKPEEPKPEEQTPIPVEDLLKDLDFVLYLRDTKQGEAQALLLSDDRPPIKMNFDPADVQSAVDTLFLTIQPALVQASGIKAKANPNPTGIMSLFKRPTALDLKIAVLVSSREVRHITGILLRNRVELFVADWNADPQTPPLELEWEDDLEVAR
jgi:hypothetical protein